MKKLALIMSVVMLMTLTTGIVFSAEEKATQVEMLTGTVQDIDAEGGMIVILANDEEQTLKAEPKMLEGIDVGQKVNIEKSGDVIKSIRVDTGSQE